MTMPTHELHVVTTGRQELEELKSIVSRWEPGWVSALHLREKARGARELVRWYEELSAVIPHTPIYLNDRLDAALAVGAPGVQLGFASLPPETARLLLPPGTRIGCSVHAPDEAVDACRRGADYIVYGHVYETASKPGSAPRGIAALRETVEAAERPVIAIGGVKPEHVREVLAAGAAGIAVLSGILLAPDPSAELLRYRMELEEAQGCMPMPGKLHPRFK